MIQQLSFDFALIRQKKGCCLMLLVTNLAYIIAALTVFHLSLKYGVISTFLLTAINVNVIMLLISLHTESNGTYRANYESCIYFPTKCTYILHSKIIIELIIIAYHCVISSVLYILSNHIYEQSFVLKYWLVYMLAILLVGAVVGSIVMVTSFSGNVFRTGIIIGGTLLGMVLGVLMSLLEDESQLSDVTVNNVLITISIILAIPIVTYVITRVIVKHVNV